MKPPEEPRPPGALRDPEKKGIGERVAEGAKDKAVDVAFDWLLRLLVPLLVGAGAGAVAGAATGWAFGAAMARREEAAVAPVAPVGGAQSSGAGGSGASARLRIESTPPGARATVDGRIVGVTPVPRVDVDPGEHPVVVELAGYEPFAQNVTAVSRAELRVTATLAPATTVAAAGPGRPRRWGLTPSAPQRDCDGLRSSCRERCDSAAFRCRSACPYCGSCVTSMTWEECNRQCSECRQGCEQNETFCGVQCDGQYDACRS